MIDDAKAAVVACFSLALLGAGLVAYVIVDYSIPVIRKVEDFAIGLMES